MNLKELIKKLKTAISGRLHSLVGWRCMIGLHTWDYEKFADFELHEYRACKECKRLDYFSATFGRFKRLN